ncbi:hypothetical protein [Paenibacillus lentus]|uniref:Uncharacterized protein n=1 Tax=Paenibacillus lentus TaxID=1338368 RepID=A0A3Q8S4X5_9BACL|nr:hypothetical protein [Paenibacillus lentus]AZK46790.1 hypothetical protein EIM92_12045 [Paenibacillus lentus]
MCSYRCRMNEIIRRVARKAWRRPLLNSGLWFHGDIRDNYYYASYLFAAAVDLEEMSIFDREEGKQLAEKVLYRVLQLQDTNPHSPMYGHWPLNLHPAPEQALPHELPVELMGSLMVYFYHNYAKHMSCELAESFEAALRNVYKGNFYRKPLEHYGHHEAKFTAAKLIFGQKYNDQELIEDGRDSLRRTLEMIRKEGMAEYGALPWFWHWIQAFTCAFELMEDEGLKVELAEMLDYLWRLRASLYLKGAWVGAHSRGWPHDAPKDANVLHDYVQFGDFELPEKMPRTEYAGLLFRAAPESARSMALIRKQPSEVCSSIIKRVEGQRRVLHSYVYITEQFAAGGLWERVKEFDNEQLRWLFSLPVRSCGLGNQLYFFHPGDGFDPSGCDPRHQSEWMEVLYHQNVVIALYPLPGAVRDEVIGVIPEGEWLEEPEALYGKVEEAYFAVYLTGPYEIRQQDGYRLVVCRGRRGGVVVEAVGAAAANERGILDLGQFAGAMSQNHPRFTVDREFQVDYTGILSGKKFCLSIKDRGGSEALIDGQSVCYDDYHYRVL